MPAKKLEQSVSLFAKSDRTERQFVMSIIDQRPKRISIKYFGIQFFFSLSSLSSITVRYIREFTFLQKNNYDVEEELRIYDC